MTDELDKMLVEKVSQEVLANLEQRYGADWRFTHEMRIRALENSQTKRRIIEQITGTAGAVGIMAILGWLGANILELIQEKAGL